MPSSRQLAFAILAAGGSCDASVSRLPTDSKDVAAAVDSCKSEDFLELLLRMSPNQTFATGPSEGSNDSRLAGPSGVSTSIGGRWLALATCQEFPADMYEPVRCIPNNAPPKRFYRAFWRRVTRRILERARSYSTNKTNHRTAQISSATSCESV